MTDVFQLLQNAIPCEWIEIQGHPGYWVSKQGDAASVRNGKVRLLSGTKCGYGYRALSMPLESGGYKRLYIHRAVCSAFHGEPSAGLHARHLDCDLSNNRADNLAWGTAIENAQDARRCGKTLYGERNPMAKLTESAVYQMMECRSKGLTYKQIAKLFNVSTMTAFRAVNGQSWTRNKYSQPL